MMSDIDIMFVKERMMEIIELRHSISNRDRLIEAEKAKTETAAGLLKKANSERDDIQKKLTAMCRCINGLVIANLSNVSPKQCKTFIIKMKKDIENCVKEHYIHFNTEGNAE